MIMALLAVSFSLFTLCSSCMAFRPMGVAALSRPSMLAEMFMKMEPSAGCPLGISGKRRVNTGLRKRASRLINPLSSPTFISPIHKVSVPVSPRHISKASFDMVKVESIIAGNASVSPRINLITPTRKAKTKRAIQI